MNMDRWILGLKNPEGWPVFLYAASPSISIDVSLEAE
jgi:hypothetical protein